MVVLSLVLETTSQSDHQHRLSLLYMISIIVSCIGEEWAYYILGSVIEVILLLGIALTAWRWPPPQTAAALPSAASA